jgi:hypothetical protein
MERRYVLFTDDEDEAFAELQNRRALAGNPEGNNEPRYRGWDICEVADMDNPPDTNKKYCVFQLEENK